MSLRILAYEKKDRRRVEGAAAAASTSLGASSLLSGVIVADVSRRTKAPAGTAADGAGIVLRGKMGLGEDMAPSASTIASAMPSRESSRTADSELGIMAPSRDMLMGAGGAASELPIEMEAEGE